MTNHSLTEVPQDADDAALLVSIFGAYDGPAATRQKILAMEAVMQQAPQILSDMPLFHHYADGLYSRELHVAAGTMLTGAIHKSEHLNIILKGDISVLTEDGMQRVRAPAMLVSKPGTKRIGFAHEDTVWLTVHASDAKTPEAAWHELVTAEFADLLIEPIQTEQYGKPALVGQPIEAT